MRLTLIALLFGALLSWPSTPTTNVAPGVVMELPEHVTAGVPFPITLKVYPGRVDKPSSGEVALIQPPFLGMDDLTPFEVVSVQSEQPCTLAYTGEIVCGVSFEQLVTWEVHTITITVKTSCTSTSGAFQARAYGTDYETYDGSVAGQWAALDGQPSCPARALTGTGHTSGSLFRVFLPTVQ